MIVSNNNKPSLDDFRKLMENTDNFLNADVKKREDYFSF